MKFIILSLFWFFPIISYAQDCTYTHIDSNKLSKDFLYKSIREWVSKTFVNANSVLKMDDKELGKIVCKGSFSIEAKKSLLVTRYNNITFTLTIDIKDNKYRLQWEDLYDHSRVQGIGDGGSLCNAKPKASSLEISAKRWKQIKENAANEVHKFNNSISEFVNNAKNDNF